MVFFYWDYVYIWMFPKIWVPQNGWFTMEILIKTDDLGVPLFLETPIYIYIYYNNLGGGNSNIFYFHPGSLGK